MTAFILGGGGGGGRGRLLLMKLDWNKPESV